jgi:hypothetical protein
MALPSRRSDHPGSYFTGANMTIEAIVDTYLSAYCDPDATTREASIQRVWNPSGRLVDPPMESAGYRGLSDQAATLLAQFPGHVFKRTTEIDHHHEFATYGWALCDPAGKVAVEGRDFMALDVDGRIMSVVGFFGAARPLSPSRGDTATGW